MKSKKTCRTAATKKPAPRSRSTKSTGIKSQKSRVQTVSERDMFPYSQLSKARQSKGQKRSRDITYTVTVYGERTGRKTFATPEEANIYAQRLARRKKKNTILIPGNFPVTHRYNLKGEKQ